MAEILDKVYDPQRIEEKWYKYWEEQGLFRAKADGSKPPYCIVIPPPNVTGVLHMGHALNNTLQDILVRSKRMQGFDALWMPGTDHAGIATQNVVERKLAAEGTDRHDLGREAFIQRVWQWKAESGGQIINQLKRLGASCDWSRERFTLDEGLSRAVREVFVRLYEEGLIYKGDYIINWCPRCRTALADLEVEHDPHDGHLYHIRYPLADGDGHLTVATTRPETLLGDTAVAVNPEDKRYLKFHGATLRLPVLGREIPVITDSYVSLEFGTGALKITPAHDFNDFEVARRHDLPGHPGHRRRRQHDQGGRPQVRGHGPLRLPGADRQGPEKARPAGEGGALRGAGGPLLPLQGHRRAPGLQTVVRGGQAPGRGGHGRGAGRPHQTHPGQLGQELLRLDEQYPGLVHLPPDLVGPPHPGLDL